MSRVLIIAFDGLDYELIKKFKCQNIIQKEFGKIENSINISQRITSELFASFITGKTYKEHGIMGYQTWSNNPVNKIESFIMANATFLNKFRLKGLRYYIYKNLFGLKQYVPKRKHLKNIRTIFDLTNNSKALNVPAYTTSPLLMAAAYWRVLLNGGNLKEVEKITEMEYDYEKKELNNELKKQYDLLMAHFQKPDIYQHMYGDWGNYNEEKIKKMYYELDKLAETIKEKAQKKYDAIIFMSDHGRVDEIKQHNTNAFYSSNIKLNLKNPHITDFYGIIKNLIGSSNMSLCKDNKEIEEDRHEDKIIKRLKELGYV